jgi:hypothetical protein
MLVILKVFHTEFVALVMTSLSTKFHMSRSIGSLIISLCFS